MCKAIRLYENAHLREQAEAYCARKLGGSQYLFEGPEMIDRVWLQAWLA